MPHSRAFGLSEIPYAPTQGIFRFVDNLMYESVRIYTYMLSATILYTFYLFMIISLQPLTVKLMQECVSLIPEGNNEKKIISQNNRNFAPK